MLADITVILRRCYLRFEINFCRIARLG